MKNMTLGFIKPKEDNDDPSSSIQVEPPTSATPSQDQVEEVEDGQAPVIHPKIHNAIAKDHPIDQILGDVSKGVLTRSRVASFCEHYSFVSSIEPKYVEEALDDPD